jgi:hypothetical protein
MLNSKIPFIAVVCLLTLAVVALADTKVKSRQTTGGQTYENTIYIKGKRQRSENSGGQMIMLQQCDLRRNIQIMPQAQAYMIQPYDQPAGSTPSTTGQAMPSASGIAKKGGVVTSTVTTRDTGERKQMLGYTARHIITSMVMTSSPDACSQVNTRMEIDGWYIDAAFALDCDIGRPYVPPSMMHSAVTCRDRYETKQVGAARKGFPVWEKTTMLGPTGAESFSTLNEVLEISQATLEQSLFEIPEGYREVSDFASLFGAPATPSPSSTQVTISSNPDGSAVNPSKPSTAAPAVGPKKEGVIRLGLVKVKAGAVAENMNAGNLAAAVQSSFPDQLKKPNVEVVAIDATALPAIETEARQKQVDYLIYATVTHKKGGGGFGSVFSSAASTVAGNVGYGSTAAAVAANASVAVVTSEIKAKDELTLDVRLEPPGASYPVLSKQFKGKAKSAGEDIITPAVAQAAQAIVAAVAK